MTAATDRARGLARIAAVQAEMVKLAEWKLAAARRHRDGLAEERRLLAALVGGEDVLGAALARAALRTAKGIERRFAEAELQIATLDEEMGRLRRRDHAVTRMSADAKTAARREAESEALGETMEAWLARASLPQGS